MQIGPRIRFDNHTLGNVLKNFSPALGLLGGPVGMAASFGAGALGEGLRGKTGFGDMAKAGLSNAAIGGGMNALKGAFIPGSGGGATTAMGGGRGMASASPTSEAFAAPTNGFTGAAATQAPMNTAQRLGGLAQRAGNTLQSKAGQAGAFAQKNPTAVGMAMQGYGAAQQAGTQHEMQQMQLRQMQQDEERRRRVAQTLSPILAQLIGQVGGRGGYSG